MGETRRASKLAGRRISRQVNKPLLVRDISRYNNGIIPFKSWFTCSGVIFSVPAAIS